MEARRILEHLAIQQGRFSRRYIFSETSNYVSYNTALQSLTSLHTQETIAWQEIEGWPMGIWGFPPPSIGDEGGLDLITHGKRNGRWMGCLLVVSSRQVLEEEDESSNPECEG